MCHIKVHAQTLIAQSLPHFFIAFISAISRDAPVSEEARFGLAATVRASFGVYNGRDDVDALVTALGKVREIFRSWAS